MFRNKIFWLIFDAFMLGFWICYGFVNFIEWHVPGMLLGALLSWVMFDLLRYWYGQIMRDARAAYIDDVVG